MTPDEFPEAFARGWSLPKPDAFLDYFLPMIAEDATFTQPALPTAIGHEQIARTFRRLFALLPDMVAIPEHTAVTGGTVFIESACTATLAGTAISFRVCDHFELRHGTITSRHSFPDPIPLLATILRHPSTWTLALQARRI
ncbi:nuclear transport factor 2 family protein [Prauserella cavernicola]|uniref:Nuclear transport factor 2 family protein n=1 Tax=Prauserella cavernicola TaxID=2800127 RepID=A0A934V6V5_9PSEU|nr:nuclear transport factor 2 family protein [Prauserella cavernicola]MBK1786610.1 nuclear transport factor 2 family protein [Prauserella cavernicola]